MEALIAQLDPAWISNLLFIVGGFIAKKALGELKEMKKDLDSIRMTLAMQYPTKEEVHSIAKSVHTEAASHIHDRMMGAFYTRAEGEGVEEAIKDIRHRLNKGDK